jgi:general secretion pathway protein D
MRLRDGESNLLAGLLREDERRFIRGIPGIIHIPFLKEIAASNDNAISQTDIVMLLTPRIIRTHELTARDLSPIYVGTNQNFGLGGPPPLIAAPPEPEPAPAAPPGLAPPVPPQGVPVPTVPPGGPPGQVTTPAPQAAAVPPPQTATTTTTPPPPSAQGAQPPLAELKPAAPPATPQQASMVTPPAQVSVTAPVGDVRVAGGPYIVPVYISGVSRVSTVALTLSFNPMAFRVRIVQEGSFLRQGAANVVFEQKVDTNIGRIDLTLVRSNDSIGASGSGLLASVVFDAVGLGNSPLTLSGVATDPGGMPLPLQFLPSPSVVVR